MTCTAQPNSHSGPAKYLTLSQAARSAPGDPHPSPNCIWRWCRRGVLARDGRRIYLNHVRCGGKMYTTAAWVEAFCRELTEADRAYFAGKDEAANQIPPREPRYGPPSGRRSRREPEAPALAGTADLERELQEEGL